MKYKLELITVAAKLVPMIAAKEEQLFILKNDRDDRLIQSMKGEKSLGKHSKAILEAQTKMDAASSLAATLPDGPLKNKQLGIVETQKARLFVLNLPVEINSEEDVVGVEIEKSEQDVLIDFHQDVLDHLLTRQTELLGG